MFQNDVYPSYSSWLVSYIVDMQPYENVLLQLSDELLGLETALNATRQYFQTAHYVAEVYEVLPKTIFDSVELELEKLKADNIRLQKRYENTLQIATKIPPKGRFKRGALNFVGDLMSDLFGTTTHKQLNKVKSNFEKLKFNQDQVIHVVQDSLTLLNQTHEEVRVNRDAIMGITTTLNNIKNEILFVKNYVRTSNAEMGKYHAAYIRLQGMFSLISITLQDALIQLLELSFEIQQIAEGNMPPTIFPPNLFLKTLKSIESHLNITQALPFPATQEHLIKYYKLLEPTLVQMKNQFLIVFALPIVNTKMQYFLYKFVQVPVPNLDGTLVARYAPENEYLLISTDRLRYTLLSPKEVENCNESPICTFQSPLLITEHNPSCLIAVFKNNVTLTEETCKKIITPAETRPVIEILFGRHFLISTITPISGKKTCNHNQEYEFSIEKGIKYFEVEDGCEIKTKYFEIPPNFHGKTSIARESHFQVEKAVQLMRPEIWSDSNLKPFNNITGNENFKNISLKKIDKIPIDKLKSILTSNIYKDIHSDNHFRSIMPPWVVGLTIAFVTLIILLCFYKYCATCRSLCTKHVRHPQPSRTETFNDADVRSDTAREAAETAETLNAFLTSA